MTSKLFAAVLVLSMLSSGFFLRQSQAPIPVLAQHVMDFTNSLTYNEWRSLEDRLKRVKDTTNIHIAILVVERVTDQPLDRYAATVFSQNQLGQNQGERGILIVVTAEQHGATIQLGPGLEEVVTRETADIILENEVLPLLKQDNLYGGLAGGVLAITAGVVGQYEGTPASGGVLLYVWIIGGFLILGGVVFLLRRGRSGSSKAGSPTQSS